MTINMMIDKDLLAIAVEDDDGFTSTIVQKQLSSARHIPRDKPRDKPRRASTPCSTASRQTTATTRRRKLGRIARRVHCSRPSSWKATRCIMTSTRRGSRADRRAATASLSKAGFDTDGQTVEQRHRDATASWVPPRCCLSCSCLQVIHHSREAFAHLADVPEDARAALSHGGQPGDAGLEHQGLALRSHQGQHRRGNPGADDLLARRQHLGGRPCRYPLVHVSLTDRFEEIIGSRVLDPAEYLSGDADPRRAIAAGRVL